MSLKANNANYENCSTYASQHPAVSQCWGSILNIYNIKCQCTQHIQVHDGVIWASKCNILWRPYWIWPLWRLPKVAGSGGLAKSLEHALGYIWAKFGAFKIDQHKNIHRVPHYIAEILSIMLIKANYENCPTYASQHPAVSTYWGPILNIYNIMWNRHQAFVAHLVQIL